MLVFHARWYTKLVRSFREKVEVTHKTMTKTARQGFTLIEILIVVAIIAILASIVLVGLGPTQQSGRDARRLADLHEIQNALELYYNKCGLYPNGANCAAANTTGYAGGANPAKTAILGSSLGINQMPDDPTSGAHYSYAANAGATSYVVQAKLENSNNSVFNTYTPPTSTVLSTYTVGDSISCLASGDFYCMTL